MCLLVSIILGGIYSYCRITNQNKIIGELQNRVENLSNELAIMSENKIIWLEDGYNYLAIGNSITWHKQTSFWWNEVGMAASDADHDYYHLVLDYLKGNCNQEVVGQVYNFYVWEVLSHDRDETLSLLDSFLDQKLDLITIQLGENVGDLATYQNDYISLINYIKEKAPNARILVIGDFWGLDNRDTLEINAVTETQVEYISLEGIADNTEYYCGLGTMVYDVDGNEHIVEHGGVAAHPGDKGMSAIAERIIDALEN